MLFKGFATNKCWEIKCLVIMWSYHSFSRTCVHLRKSVKAILAACNSLFDMFHVFEKPSPPLENLTRRSIQDPWITPSHLAPGKYREILRTWENLRKYEESIEKYEECEEWRKYEEIWGKCKRIWKYEGIPPTIRRKYNGKTLAPYSRPTEVSLQGGWRRLKSDTSHLGSGLEFFQVPEPI